METTTLKDGFDRLSLTLLTEPNPGKTGKSIGTEGINSL
jgi:hypothetical protein